MCRGKRNTQCKACRNALLKTYPSTHNRQPAQRDPEKDRAYYAANGDKIRERSRERNRKDPQAARARVQKVARG